MPVVEWQLLLRIQDVAIAAGERDRRKLIESGQPPGGARGLQIRFRHAQVLVVGKRFVDQAVEQGVRKPGPISLDGIPVLETRLAGIGEVCIDRRFRSMIVGTHCTAREDRRKRHAADEAAPRMAAPRMAGPRTAGRHAAGWYTACGHPATPGQAPPLRRRSPPPPPPPPPSPSPPTPL